MYTTVLKHLKERNSLLKVVGLSATPYRLKGGLLSDGPIFTDIAYDCTGMNAFNKLISDGFLCPLVPKNTSLQLDVEGVKIAGGDYVAKHLQIAVDKEAVTRAAIAEIIEQGKDRKHWLIFSTGIEHSEHIKEELEQHGISCGIVHSKDPKNRDKAISDFKSGKTRALVNTGILTTGFNFKALDLIAVLRPTQSPGLWVQMLGRGTRVFDGKLNCLVLDFAGNTQRLGPINAVVLPNWYKKRNGGKPGQAPVRICPQCNTILHASVMLCECGHKFEKRVNFFGVAGSHEVIAKETIIEHAVKDIYYNAHKKAGGKTSLRVRYVITLNNIVSEFVCLEHDGFARSKARKWWRDRSDMLPPATVEEALKHVDNIKQPTHIKIKRASKFPEILAFKF
jgi:DNA repair protein RadD